MALPTMARRPDISFDKIPCKAVLPALLLAGWLAMPGQALAQQGHTGIAFAYAPEQGFGMCTGDSPEALNCARSTCAETSGAYPSDCARVAWCFPSGWSFSVAFMANGGLHWSEFYCGWPSKQAAIDAGNLLCKSQDSQRGIEECMVGTLWDPQGRTVEP